MNFHDVNGVKAFLCFPPCTTGPFSCRCWCVCFFDHDFVAVVLHDPSGKQQEQSCSSEAVDSLFQNLKLLTASHFCLRAAACLSRASDLGAPMPKGRREQEEKNACKMQMRGQELGRRPQPTDKVHARQPSARSSRTRVGNSDGEFM